MSQNHLQLHLRKCSLHKNYSDVYPGEVVKRPFHRRIRRDAVSVRVVSQATENKCCAIVVHKCQNFGGGLKECTWEKLLARVQLYVHHHSYTE